MNMPAPQNVYDIVQHQESTFRNVLTDEKIVWEKECQFAMQRLQANEFLNKAAWANQQSLQNAIINVASVGISLNPVLKHAYLVPRKVDGSMTVCLDISYMGLLHLAMQSGSIMWGQAKLVYAKDKYVNTGVDTKPIHEQDTFGDKGAIVGVYCTVKLPSGDYLTEEMDITTLNKIKDASVAAKGPWKTWPEEMMRKAVVKRGSKYWPKVGDRLARAIDVLNEHEGNVVQLDNSERDITPVTQSETVNQLIEEKPVEDGKVNNIADGIDDAKTVAALKKVGATINELPDGMAKDSLKDIYMDKLGELKNGKGSQQSNTGR